MASYNWFQSRQTRRKGIWQTAGLEALRGAAASIRDIAPHILRRLPWRWAAAVAFGLAAAGLFLRNDAQPAPDFAAGSDQELLVGIERALRNDIPEALQPLTLITDELDAALRTPTDTRR